MSTERQDCSLEAQKATIAAYALEHGFRVVETYEDAGISGLTIEKRPGLRRLIGDILSDRSSFELILVYDVSRWGRFQNPDESAYYEFICSEAGVRVEYCAEPFDNDGSPTSTLIKQIKRAMAAEYSRELSAKISLVKRRLALKGFWPGGPPGYGLRRQTMTRDGRVLAVQDAGEWGARGVTHTRLVQGPAVEVETVQRIYRLFLKRDGSYASIVRLLNSEGIAAENGASWTLPRVRQVLTNEKYIGRIVAGRTRDILGIRVSKLPRSEWIHVEGALQPIVSKQLFARVQNRIASRRERITDASAIADLQRIYALKGKLTQHLIRAHGRWSPALYIRRLGGLPEIYARLGYEMPPVDQRRLTSIRHALAHRALSPYKHQEANLLERVKAVWAREGALSQRLLNNSGVPASTLLHRFGSLSKVYELIGYPLSPRQRIAIYSRKQKAGRLKHLSNRDSVDVQADHE